MSILTASALTSTGSIHQLLYVLWIVWHDYVSLACSALWIRNLIVRCMPSMIPA